MLRLLRWCAALVALGAIVVGSLAAWAWLAVRRPQLDRPESADAVIVLSGDLGDRMRGAMQLMADEVAPTLVHAGTPDSQTVRDLCNGAARPFQVVCLQPNPDNTRAEARAVARLVEARGWESLVVVTSKPHASRARLHFDRCTDADLAVVGTTPMDHDEKHEWLGLLHAVTVGRGC